MKHVFSFATLAFFAFLFYASSSSKKVTAPPKQTFTFEYKTPNTAKPGATNMLIALVRPSYANSFVYSHHELFDNFRKFMGDDIQQILNDKGFNLLNKTFTSFDELTYDDKKNVELAFDIHIDPTFTAASGGWHTYSSVNWGGKLVTEYAYSGTVSITGKIVMKGIEPMTGQQIITKSLNIPAVENISLITSGRFPSAEFTSDFFNDPSVYNALGTALQKSYTNIMQQIDTYLDPREISSNSNKSLIKELKGKKVY